MLKLDQHLKSILEVARYAPSVHNSQPWRVTQDGNSLCIAIDPALRLKRGDPTGRETFISLGIFAEAVCGAAGEVGFTVSGVELSGQEAIVRLGAKTNHPSKQDARDSFSSLLKSRCTDRSVFQKMALGDDNLRALDRVQTLPDTRVHISTDEAIIRTTAELTAKAIRVALSDPAFRRELAGFLTLPWSKGQRGISVLSLGIPTILAICEPLLMRLGIGLNKEASTERRRWQSASAVVFITARGDMPRFWFAVGRTYLRVSLEIEHLGLSQATSAAIVEASNYHEDIEELLGTKDRILAVLRIGKGTRGRHYSRRVGTDELLH